jgi:hypothetical protein
MLKIWLIYNLFITAMIFGTSLSSAKSITNYLLPFLLLPLIYYLGKETLKKSKRRKLSDAFDSSITVGADPHVQPEIAIEGEIMPQGISDDNRRLFLKLVGSTGLSIVIMAIFGKKSAQAAFFGSVPGPGTVSVKDSTGATIDPAEKQSTDGYEISQVDDSTTPAYYGFVHKTGAWYITKEDATGAYRYAKGAVDFATSWTSRAGLTYDYFDAIF